LEDIIKLSKSWKVQSFEVKNSSTSLVYRDYYENIYNHTLGSSYDPIKYTMSGYSVNLKKSNTEGITLYIIPIAEISSNQATDKTIGSKEYLNKLVYNMEWERDWFRSGSEKNVPSIHINGHDLLYAVGHKKYDEIYECVAAYYPLQDTILLAMSRFKYDKDIGPEQKLIALLNSTKIIKGE
jgi:hypothetical protein